MSAPEDILNQFRIAPTQRRVELLKLILGIEKPLFSIKDLHERVAASNLTISNNTLVTTLLLFVTRKLLHAFPSSAGARKRGRPVMLYMMDPALQQMISSEQIRP